MHGNVKRSLDAKLHTVQNVTLLFMEFKSAQMRGLSATTMILPSLMTKN